MMTNWWEYKEGESTDEARDRRFLDAPILDGAEIDTLVALRKVIWDGDLPSKTARDSLVRQGLAVRWNGYQVVSAKGMAMLNVLKRLQEIDRMKLTRR